MALAAIGASAENFAHSLIVNKKSGESVEYKFEADPRVTFDAEDMVISTGDATVRHAIADLEKLTFTKTVGLDKVEASNVGISVAVTASYVSVKGLESGARLSVYALDGRFMADAVADASGAVTVNITNLSAGIYVAASDAHSFKFVKK